MKLSGQQARSLYARVVHERQILDSYSQDLVELITETSSTAIDMVSLLEPITDSGLAALLDEARRELETMPEGEERDKVTRFINMIDWICRTA